LTYPLPDLRLTILAHGETCLTHQMRLLFFGLLIFLTGCSPQFDAIVHPAKGQDRVRSVTITVFAAASLTDPFTEIGLLFEAAQPEVRVVFNFAGSQQLAQQLSQGAPADLFASANQKQMAAAVASGRVLAGKPKILAQNRLVVIFPQDNPAGLKRLQDLAKPGLTLVLAAEVAPAGQYALDFLAKASQEPAFGPHFKEQTLKNVVSFEQNVRAVLIKVALGEADAGIVYSSDLSGRHAGEIGHLDIPDHLNTLATYLAAPTRDSPNPGQAQAFVNFLLSPAGQEILAKHGFIPLAPQ